MLDRNLLEKKMNLLVGYIAELEVIIADSVVEILKDNNKYHATERIFQLIVDTMIDINIHLIKEGKLGAPDDFEGTFKLLGKVGVLDDKFAIKIAPIVGLRNRVVHQYDSLNMEEFIGSLKKDFFDFKEYLIQIENFLKRQK
ncbi:MAG: hypothetical protein A3D52_00930 [Candidatus Taylorbacteria bacterium RIFCSPHIGHO2_02_FULL_44_36]|uniref:DUF86 domain-containing protein n=1 Tax=Candidatus Taylorbacteria bacterium RIFCSPLOWO2_12_FULL_44_15c TaxID=1802333 RepID=A0A1G2P613_9BACT|nr:MAG: hypothetical protein A3D52_00930 [Candidatus Taylorbacteria bacterium RIFCSPHIGHO2_02_FULL_44_36]OHA37723.1 MAG: hypothetical protein A3I97_03225 [Candidatus Taylorbacteria bacterium RIFCSPLOWO2_02_FULL_44_35]OHA43778.1 MAG: hypothetical protein A3G03_02130 [Candidatus Taylorbacteria bacterium RIFCSPLOWO2_12_FULL_44_15c]